MGKTIESLVMEFDQAKYEEFPSFGSKITRAQQYRKVSSEVRSQVPSGTFPKMACAKSVISPHITRNARVDVSHEIREANGIEGQFSHALPLPQLQVTGGSQQPVKCSRNVERRQRRRECRQRRRARRQQM